jgi:ATP-dependent helicase HrpB
VEQWIARLNSLALWRPDLQLTPIGSTERKELLTRVCFGAVTYREIKDRPVWPIIKGWLHPGQQATLDRLAPERIELPQGRRAKLTYSGDGQPPVLAARIQDLYEVPAALTICGGKVPVLIHVLAPNHRPIQITRDLSTFWRDAYPKIKQELRRKYPKHEWR